MIEETQEIYEKKNLKDYMASKNLNAFSATLKPDAVRYFIAEENLQIAGLDIPKGGVCVSLFGGNFGYMAEEEFLKWVIPTKDAPMPEPPKPKPIQGKVINSNSDDFDNYVKENKIFTFDAEIIPTRRECFEAREDLKILTNEGAIFEVEGGEFVIKDLESGNVFKNKADYFNSHYKRVPREAN